VSTEVYSQVRGPLKRSTPETRVCYVDCKQSMDLVHGIISIIATSNAAYVPRWIQSQMVA
jgi:hypothetical protein